MRHGRRFVGIVLALAGFAWMNAAQAAELSGTAFYRERIALPPSAVFVATLEDVSRADAPAEVLGRVEVAPAGQVPIAFAIPYDPARIDPRFTYAVRATIRVDGRLRFTTTTVHPVLTRGHGDRVELLLQRVAERAAAPLP